MVGPNGCGKSNIIDAIRWCMGEMSAKHLRGRAMQDVILRGSDSRGPLGMAEVTLTFDTEGGDVPPQYAAYSEISITHRLHRDGTSEYLINNIQMRLRTSPTSFSEPASVPVRIPSSNRDALALSSILDLKTVEA